MRQSSRSRWEMFSIRSRGEFVMWYTVAPCQKWHMYDLNMEVLSTGCLTLQ